MSYLHGSLRDYDERLAWIRLIRTERIGPRQFYSCLQVYGSAREALAQLPHLMSLRGTRTRVVTPPSQSSVVEEYERLLDAGGDWILASDHDYPLLLRRCPDHPPVLSCLGRRPARHSRTVAIVGARYASVNGCRLARQWAKAIGEAGITVVSGLARGIDTAAHEGSLATGTIAVMAGGINHIYPPENADLYDRIRHQGGSILAELSWGAAPRSHHFPQRNRIIAGLASGVLVVEAALQSGSLITARMALDYGREVFAVPGFVGDPRAKGTNQLIQQGALLVQAPEDVVEALELIQLRARTTEEGEEILGAQQSVRGASQLSQLRYDERQWKEAKQIIDQAIGYEPVAIEWLVAGVEVPYALMQLVILEGELAGDYERRSGNRVVRLLPEHAYGAVQEA